MRRITRTGRAKRMVLATLAAAASVFPLMSGPLAGQTQRSQASPGAAKAGPPFHLQEATIEDIHRAIRSGQTTCRGLVQAYVDRAKAYDGTCVRLVTKDGAPVPPAKGAVRAGSPLSFPTATTAVSAVLPSFDQYAGPPIEFGRMEATASDPTVQQQFGMVVGVPRAGGVNALATLNIRGERSVTCKAACDSKPSSGPLPASCPTACDAFRRQPDALERAAELDAQYARNPDLTKLPMYCIPFAFKDVFGTKDMRTTGGGDVNYAMDAAPEDSTIVAQLRAKGAIIYAKANLDDYNAGGGDPGGPAKAESRSYGAGTRSTWAGTACNPYDTERETGGSSSGSAASVAANLEVCSICEETGGSCRQPAYRNAVVAFVTTKGLIPYGGAIGADPFLDRAGIQCRTVKDAALVLDALKDPQRGYFDPKDPYSALPKALVSKTPYASFVVDSAGRKASGKPLAGMRIGIVREYMVKHTQNDVAMSDQVNDEIKRVLRDQLGAEIVESFDPLYPDDPDIPNMVYTFQRALAEILPFHVPEYFFKKSGDGLEFSVPGYDVTTRDYMVLAAEGKAPLSDQLNLRRITNFPGTRSFGFHIAQYLLERGDVRVRDWATLNANSKFDSDSERADFANWEFAQDMRSEGLTERMKMREAMKLVVLKVMHQNNLDVLVNPTITIPPSKIGGPSEPRINSRPTGRFPTSADSGIPEIAVPAGFNRFVYEPQYVLSSDRTDYRSATGTVQSTLEHALPVSIGFWAGPGEEPTLLKVASAYQTATKHRIPPPDFGPVPGEP